MNKSEIAEVCVFMHSYHTGHYDEDGRDVIGDRFFLVAEMHDGRRYAHGYNFFGLEAYEDEEGMRRFENVSEAANAAAEKLANKVRKCLAEGHSLDRSKWYEIDPAYGSQAYIEKDNFGYFKDREKREGAAR